MSKITISVDLVDIQGSDAWIATNAWICTGHRDLNVGDQERVERLLAQLIRDGHTSPFEQARMAFRLRVPIFVMRQIVRHRTASMLERSLRYTTASEDDFLPLSLADNPDHVAEIHDRACWDAFAYYREMLALGAPPEVARRVLPLATMTEAIWTMDLRNLLHFLRLRQDSAVQAETRQVADMVAEHVAKAFPITWAAWIGATDEQIGRF